MKELIIVASFIFASLLVLANKSEQTEKQDSGQTIRHVAPNAVGNGDGTSVANAADFLNSSFWTDIQILLQTSAVKVKFAAGDYSHAYAANALRIENMGNVHHSLLLEGDLGNTVFTVPAGSASAKSQMIKILNSVNITIRNFHFTGDGKINYVLNITSDPEKITKEIRIENCTWTDMRGIVYGATGATQAGTSNITFKNCSFKRVGYNAGSHMIYNAYGSHHIRVFDSYFEDCPGDYIRFRDKCDYAIVKGCTFLHPQNIRSIKFISMPLYNDGKPYEGNESFATNYSFTNNSFTSTYPNVYSIGFSSKGYSPKEYNYLLTVAEGDILTNGTPAQKKSLLETNFGIYTDQVRVYNNTYSTGIDRIYLGSYIDFGAVSKGWVGKGDITAIINKSAVPFSWE